MENILSIIFCLTLFYTAVTSRVKAYVSILRIQGILLAVLLVLPFINKLSFQNLLLPLTIILVKVIFIPLYINRIIINLDIKRRIEPTIQQISFLAIAIFTILVIFLFTDILSYSAEFEVIPFASGFSAIMIGIYIIMFRKKLIVHVTGFLILENGIFLIGTAIASELPLLIELGILLDVFVVVFLMGIALNKISSTLKGFEVSDLRRLKD